MAAVVAAVATKKTQMATEHAAAKMMNAQEPVAIADVKKATNA